MGKDTSKSSPRRRRVYLSAGSKGGVGKSLLSMALLHSLRSRKEQPVLVETDTSNPDVYKAYGGLVESVLLDLDDADGWIRLLNLLEAGSDRPVVVNTASRNNLAVRRFGEMLANNLEALSSELVVFWLINRQRDSLELLREFQETFATATLHVVRNEWFSGAEKFELYNTSEFRQKFESRGGLSLSFPNLADRVADQIYTERLAIETALATAPLGNRAELQRWDAKVAAMFREAGAATFREAAA